MKLIYSLKTGEVKMRLKDDGKISYDTKIMGEKIIDLTDTEKEQVEQNYKLFIKGKKLKTEKNPFKLKEDKRKEKMDKIDKATTLDELKEIIKNSI